MDQLDPEQQRALEQLREVTNGGDDDVAIGVLSSVDWDVQRAAELIFGAGPGTAPRTPAPPVVQSSAPLPARRGVMDTFEIDDTLQGRQSGGRGRRTPPGAGSGALMSVLRPLLPLLAFPLHIIANILRFVLGVLRIPVPQIRWAGVYRPSSVGLFSRWWVGGTRAGSSSGGGTGLGRGGADRWIRELEEETGAVCVGRATGSMRGSTTGFDVGPSSGGVVARNTAGGVGIGMGEDGRKVLPDFMVGQYEEALRLCERETRIGCIVLVSSEHDDVAEFKRSTLTDPAFVKMLVDNNVVVWGGDVRDKEAWSAAEKLQATTYPFVAFLALQPRRSPLMSSSRSSSSSSSVNTPTLTVLSRHQGPCIPNTSAPTSASALIAHMETQLLPRVTPFLQRVRAAKGERERERRLREEQDHAFQESARRDRERIERRAREEKEREKERQEREREEREHRENERRAKEEKEKEETGRMEWRRWIRREVVGRGGVGSKGTLRVAVRLPTGARVVQQFEGSTTLTMLYAFVDAQMIPPEMDVGGDPREPPSGEIGSPETVLEKQITSTSGRGAAWWGFRVVSAYPRVEIPWNSGVRLEDVSVLRGGGQIVVELVGGSGDDEEDGYHTEESE